jgi:hypothetical protein
MPVNFLNFTESTTPVNTDYIVGFANSNKGGERRWNFDNIKNNILSNISKTITKAWVNFNGTTNPGTIRSSYNVSSVVKTGTGKYIINFTTGFTDTNYSTVYGSTYNVSTGLGWLAFQDNRLGAKTQSQLYIATTEGTTYRDSTEVSVAAFSN